MKKIMVYMDSDVHEELKKVQAKEDLRSISAAIRKVLKKVRNNEASKTS